MSLSRAQLLQRIRACLADLQGNGIDLIRMSDPSLSCFVRTHLEYFQHMLGGELDHEAVVGLVRCITGISPVDEAYMVLAEMECRRRSPTPVAAPNRDSQPVDEFVALTGSADLCPCPFRSPLGGPRTVCSICRHPAGHRPGMGKDLCHGRGLFSACAQCR